MSRTYDFAEKIKTEAYARQAGLCGCCGRNLADLWDAAHHIVPDQAGKTRGPVDTFIGTVDNCVYLCDLCHDRVHDFNTRKGAVAPPSYFKYSHGRDQAAHDIWAMQLELRIQHKYRS